MKISLSAIAAAGTARAPASPYIIRQPAPGVAPRSVTMAQDSAVSDLYSYANGGGFNEGLQWPGFPYLSELAQRPEYRRMSETIAREMTRRWIRITATGDDDKSDKIAALKGALDKFRVQEVFCAAAEHDGLFGRGQIFLDVGSSDPEELTTPLRITKNKIAPGGFNRLTNVEPIWTYVGAYNSNNPLDPTFYKPAQWFVMGKPVHASRMLTFISRDVPDLLKPAYAFCGLSLSQIAKPYVDNWLRTRQSVSDLLHSFTVFGIKTNLGTALSGGGGEEMAMRAEMFGRARDNRGMLMIDKETEDFFNVSAPLGGLSDLQGQAQQQMAAVCGIPLTKLLGTPPTGLSASSDGEIQTFYDTIASMQESMFRRPLARVLDIIQLSEFGEIDPEISFAFEQLEEPNDSERATVRKTDCDTAVAYINAGVLTPDEVRTKLAGEEDSEYSNLDLSVEIEPPAAEPPEDDGGDVPPGGGKRPFEGSGDAMAHDREHWISTEGGSHLLIEGEGGKYTVKGGAGGSMNGKEISPKSMSKERSGGGETEAKPEATKPAHHVEAEVRAILGGKISEADIGKIMAILGREAPTSGVQSATHTVHTSAGTKIEAKPELVDLADLTTSNDDDGRINPAFPQHLQPRDRSTAASQAQIHALAGNILPERLGPSPEASSGAPIVGPDGVVESGNGRTMALRRVLTDPSLSAQREQYTSWLKSQGHNIDGIKNPMLVMRRTSDMTDAQRRKFVVEANERTTLGMGAAEQARADAARAGENIDKWSGNDAGAAGNRDFARAFMASMSPEERGNMMNPDGSLSGEGQRRIQSSVTAHAYGEKFGTILDRFLSGDSEGMKAIAGAMSDTSGAWAQMRKASADGTIPANLDITPDLASAVETIARARQLGRPVKELIDQTDLDRAPLSPTAATLLRSFFRDDDMKKPAGRDAVAGVLNKYASEAAKVSPEPDMFGTPPATAPQLLKTAMRSSGAQDEAIELGEDAIADTAWYIRHGMV